MRLKAKVVVCQVCGAERETTAKNPSLRCCGLRMRIGRWVLDALG